nr:hypothetical protein [Tanacetum cinerariifolium]
MVNTHQSTPEFLGPTFDEAVKGAINALLPGLTAQITNELCQNSAGGNGDLPPTIHTWLERFGKQKPRSFSSATTPAFKQDKGGEAYVVTLSWKDFCEILVLQYFPMSEQQKYEREYHTIRQREDELTDGIVNTEFTNVAQVANAGRNIELLRERSSSNNKRNRDGDRIQPAAGNNNQKGYN